MLFAVLIVLFAAGLINFYFSIQILRRVSASEIRISFFEIRWQVHKNMGKYRQLTRAESGRAGGALYGYWFSLLLILFCLMAFFALAIG